MKQFIENYMWQLAFILVALLASISLTSQGNWLGAGWALLAISGQGLYLRECIYKARLEKQFRDYITEHKGDK